MSPTLKWSIAIVTLLAGNLVMMVVLAVMANRTDAQVIPDYYAQATRYDEKLAADADSRALGWTAAATLSDGALEVTLRDRDGQPLDGARVTVSGYQRAHASGRYTLALVATRPGMYQAALADVVAGVHDMTIVAERDGARFTEQLVVEAR